MEKTKLTIRVPQDILERAKRYASQNRTSLTRLISEYLRQLGDQDDLLSEAPIVSRLTGILSPNIGIDDYEQYIEAKYGYQASNPD